MSAQVGNLVLGAAIHKGQRMVNLVGKGETVPTAATIAHGAEGGVPCLSRVECFLHVIDGCHVFLHVTEHAHLDIEQIAKHALVHVHVAGQVVQLVMQDNALMVHITQRHAVARPLAATHEGDVVVLQESRLLDGSLPIGVMGTVDEHTTLAGHGATVSGCVEHIQILDDMGDAHAAVISHRSALGRPLLGDDLDDTRSATRAILRRLAGVLEDCETLNVRRIN